MARITRDFYRDHLGPGNAGRIPILLSPGEGVMSATLINGQVRDNLAELQGPPKRIPPATAVGTARCQYCRTYGPLGRCQGCGAPNEPVPAPQKPTFPPNREIRAVQVPRFETVWR